MIIAAHRIIWNRQRPPIPVREQGPHPPTFSGVHPALTNEIRLWHMRQVIFLSGRSAAGWSIGRRQNLCHGGLQDAAMYEAGPVLAHCRLQHSSTVLTGGVGHHHCLMVMVEHASGTGHFPPCNALKSTRPRKVRCILELHRVEDHRANCFLADCKWGVNEITAARNLTQLCYQQTMSTEGCI